MYFEMFGQFKKTLTQMDTWLEMAAEHAKARAFDPKNYLTLRLAPDQFPFSRQVQIACDTAKLAASRVTGKDAPSQPDTEATIEELRARVASVIKYLDGFNAKDFDGADTRVVGQPRWEGKIMTGADYFREHAIPNFFFHSTLVYEILRHSGVALGKKSFLGTLSLRAQ
ncbi:MAG: DUF1993 domain-containing protein [Sandaracinaceae bacterium]|jgi:hypothetical protein|nr:DUF1993 domain-containing protein [Sandaracinaceae bacterium]